MISRSPQAIRMDRSFVAVLVGITLVVSIVSSLGAPLLPDVAKELSVSLPNAQWSLTAALVAGAVSAPILGRLGDGQNRRQAILVALVIVSAGGVIAGAAETLPVLIVGRVMQGVGLGLAPIAMAAARDHLEPDQARRTIAMLSVTAAAGLGAGYPISGLIAEQFDLHVALFFGAILSGGALVAAYLVIPSNKSGPPVSLDIPGAAVGTVGVVALLIAVGQGHEWGWLSVRVVACFVFACIVFAFWTRRQLRIPSPLVDLTQLRHRAVLGADVAAAVLGVALYMFFTVVTEFVQTPPAEGFGFGATTLVAGLCLVPFSVCSLLASRLVTPVARRFGTRTALGGGALIISIAGAFFALVHTDLWQACVMMGLLGVGFGFTYAVIPGLITSSVPPQEVGSAMGFYQVVRSIGFSVGSALVASILAAHEVTGQRFPALSGYTTALWVGAAICIGAALVAVILSPDQAGGPKIDQGEAWRDDAELAAAGIVDFESESDARTN